MTESLVPTQHTPIAARALYDALRARWTAIGVDSEPTRPRLLVLVAHVWHETGAGQSSFNWNLAGIKYTMGCGRDYLTIKTNEYVGTKEITVEAHFRAYPDLASSVADYLALVRGQFGFAWPAVEAADPRDFAHRLRVRRYYTAPEQQYADALARRYMELMSTISDEQPPEITLDGAPAIVQPDPGEPHPPPPADAA